MKAILTDVTRCIGCEKCVSACKQQNDLGPDKPFRWLVDDGLSADRWCSVMKKGQHFVRKQCRHCIEPACASACPVGALSRTPEGPVIYDSQKCLGCRYCMMACPFGIPRYAWDSAAPVVRKCQMCYQKSVSEGRPPACTEACPTGATIFGDRDQLIAEARTRLASSPDKYVQKIYGETELGGTCVLYISPVDLDFLRMGNKEEVRPLPRLTQDAMGAVPVVFIGVGAVMSGVYWVIERRIRLEKEKKDKS